MVKTLSIGLEGFRDKPEAYPMHSIREFNFPADPYYEPLLWFMICE